MSSIGRPLFLLLLAAGLFGTFGMFILGDGASEMYANIAKDKYPYDIKAPTKFSGIKHVDQALMIVPTFFLGLLHESFNESRLWSLVFFGNIPVWVVAVYIESKKARNTNRLSQYLYTILFLSQGAGLGVASPLFCYLDLASGPSLESGSLSAAEALSLIPSLGLGLGLPILIMFDTTLHPSTATCWVFAFVMYPLTLALSQRILRPAMEIFFTSNKSRTATLAAQQTSNSVTLVYGLAGMIAVICNTYGAINLTRSHGWILTLTPLSWSLDSLPEKMLLFIWADASFAFWSLALWTFVKTKKRLAQIWSNFGLATGFIAGSILLGPSATSALAWIMYENVGERSDGKKTN